MGRYIQRERERREREVGEGGREREGERRGGRGEEKGGGGEGGGGGGEKGGKDTLGNERLQHRQSFPILLTECTPLSDGTCVRCQ